jgi:hypothetical protein
LSTTAADSDSAADGVEKSVAERTPGILQAHEQNPLVGMNLLLQHAAGGLDVPIGFFKRGPGGFRRRAGAQTLKHVTPV